MTKIYTKTGDQGETSLLGGKRVGKSCLEMQVIGEIDELNAALGVALVSLRGVRSPKATERRGNPQAITAKQRDCFALLAMTIQNIQRDLFKTGSELASLQTPLAEKVEKINNDRVIEMEKMIDKFWSELPELKNFILPGGSTTGAHLHLARVICRRVERSLVSFCQSLKSEDRSPKPNLRPELYMYLNRLSDFLFAAARWVNFKAGEEEMKVYPMKYSAKGGIAVKRHFIGVKKSPRCNIKGAGRGWYARSR